MKYTSLLIILSVPLLYQTSFSQDCDCLIFPVKPACKETCGIKLLQTGTKQQLTSTLKLDEKTAEKIVSTPDRKNKKSVKAFQEDLPYAPYIDLERKFNNWISSTVVDQHNVNGDNVGRDKITNINYTSKDSLGGIIEQPKSPADFYHNARFYAISGDIKQSKKSYQKYLETDQNFVDTHFFYQELLKNIDGIEEAKNIYQGYLQQHPSSTLYQFLYARLLEREERVQKCIVLLKTDSNYMPVMYQLAVDYSRENVSDATTSDKAQRRKYLERFNVLNKNNAYFKYFLDKQEAITAVEYMDTRLNESKNNDEYFLANPAKVFLYTQGEFDNTLSFIMTEQCYEIFYKRDNDTGFKSTGFMDFVNPVTKTKFANISVAFQDLTVGKHSIAVKYINQHHEMVGPYISNFEVLSKTSYALKTFKNDILTTTWPKLATTVEMKDVLTITLVNISDFGIFDRITIQGLKDDKETPIFENGTNLTYKGQQFFNFDKIKKGQYTVIFRLNYIDKTSVAIKFTIDVLKDEGMHNFTGQIVN